MDTLLLLRQKSKCNTDINVRDKNKQKTRQKATKQSLSDHGHRRIFSPKHITTGRLQEDQGKARE